MERGTVPKDIKLGANIVEMRSSELITRRGMGRRYRSFGGFGRRVQKAKEIIKKMKVDPTTVYPIVVFVGITVVILGLIGVSRQREKERIRKAVEAQKEREKNRHF